MFDFFTTNEVYLVAIGGAVVTIASALSNIFPKATVLGKVAHFLALNFHVK